MAHTPRPDEDDDEPATQPALTIPPEELVEGENTQTARFLHHLVTEALDPSPENYRIVVIGGGELGETVCIKDKPVTVGRDTLCGISLTATGVSRVHATIIPDEKGHVLKDEGSSNGIFVNKQRITEHRLVDGDLIIMGGAALKYLSVDNPEFSYLDHLRLTSVRDPLTDAPNRRYLDDFLQREMERSRRYNRPLSVLMMDVDHFKAINDALTHAAGDVVLRELVRIVTTRLRRSEFMARYGGEEFCVVAPETEGPGAAQLGEVLRKLVENHAFTWEGQRVAVTISIGVASWNASMAHGDELIHLADERLYRAKREGRNRVVFE